MRELWTRDNKVLDESIQHQLGSPTNPRDFESRRLDSTERGEETMKKQGVRQWQMLTPFVRKTGIAVGAALLLAGTALAQQTGNSPWENAVNVLQQAFTGTIAKGLALVAIVVGGLTFAFGEGGGKRTFAGLIFGLGMAVLAVNFLTWLFGV
jgi:type IV secretory pathway VirB2 component (pilin)